MGLRKPTQMRRRSVTMTGRQVFDRDGVPSGMSTLILGPERGATQNAVRRVTISVPETPTVHVALGPFVPFEDGTDLPGVDDAGATPEDIANSRTYQWATPDAGRDYVMEICADQWIAAMADDGVADITITVEYLS